MKGGRGMSEYKFKFPLLHGGCSSGLNNAGIETFKSNPLGALARECAQNSLDAKAFDELPAKLVFRFHELPLSEIPGILDLKTAFEQCKASWSEKTQEYKFSNKALMLFECENVSVLEISDYNTTGLHGQDKEKSSAWHALVMSAGQCNKNAENAGGFGIGKSAPFAVSAWRTVFYSSLTPEGEYAFRGVCYNMTHADISGAETQGIGYYGRTEENNPEIMSLRQKDEIPALFRRKEPGTSIFVLAFNNTVDCKEKLKYAVLENFWPAIYFDKICFDINGEEICKANLAEHMAQNDNLKIFIQCLESQDKVYSRENVGALGECELYFLLTGEKRQEIICTRSSRMKIQSITTYWKMDGIGFVGLFSCLSQAGNKILKNMEPPEHSKWDYKRSNDEDDPLTETDRKKILAELKDWIREKINAQVEKNYTDETDLEDASRYFNEPCNENGDAAGGEDNNDGFSSSVTNIKVKKILTSKQKRHVDIPTDAGGDNEEDGVTASDPGSGNAGGGKGVVRSGEDGGSPGGKQAGNARKIKFSTRSFVVGDEYILILKTQEEFKGDILLLASGEEDAEKLEIISAHTDEQDLPVHCGKISKISMASDATYKIYVKTQDKEYFAVEVIGYESN